MNVNSGGPHILIFERDPQLTALLTSEFQLAGYECHAARTAVEVFDAIARYQIRLVLVNLAQAAASRREFWVALDAQRRGRGVQVFTFRCMNIAGYGADDPDERSRAVLTDMEVDGMLGVMNLVEAVRARIPGPGQTAGSFSRMSGLAAYNTPEGTRGEPVNRSQRQEGQETRTGLVGSAGQTAPRLSAVAPPPPTPTLSPAQEPPPAPMEPSARNGTPPASPPSSFTEKIRAVIYPGARSYPQAPVEPGGAQQGAPPYAVPDGSGVMNRQPGMPGAGETGTPPGYLTRTSSEESGVNAQVRPNTNGTFPVERSAATEESGLAQLSRMVRENTVPLQEVVTPPSPPMAPTPGAPSSPVSGRDVPRTPFIEEARNVEGPPLADAASQEARERAGKSAPPSLADLPLRASPIEDLPVERLPERKSGQTGSQPALAHERAAPAAMEPPPVANRPVETVVHVEEVQEDGIEGAQNGKGGRVMEQETVIDRAMIEQATSSLPAIGRRRAEPGVTSEDVLLDIVQSLPPMTAPATPPPPPQTPVLSGRATRSLGNVLLEGHLVPKDRLEVAQSIQRMLRGVDMNYQLGEILLMFKLLTPDQLLAASLVSYGLLAAPQITALGRIRQELHAIGLDYDLENLLVLFRVLTPEQLREVRASWSG